MSASDSGEDMEDQRYRAQQRQSQELEARQRVQTQQERDNNDSEHRKLHSRGRNIAESSHAQLAGMT